MSNGPEQIQNPAVKEVETHSEQAETVDTTRAPSQTAVAIERANNATSYQVRSVENSFNEVRMGESRVVVLSHESADPEKHEVAAESAMRESAFSLFKNGGLTRQKAEAPTHRPEGSEAIRLDKTAERTAENGEIDQALLTGLNSRRTGRA